MINRLTNKKLLKIINNDNIFSIAQEDEIKNNTKESTEEIPQKKAKVILKIKVNLLDLDFISKGKLTKKLNLSFLLQLQLIQPIIIEQIKIVNKTKVM